MSTATAYFVRNSAILTLRNFTDALLSTFGLDIVTLVEINMDLNILLFKQIKQDINELVKSADFQKLLTENQTSPEIVKEWKDISLILTEINKSPLNNEIEIFQKEIVGQFDKNNNNKLKTDAILYYPTKEFTEFKQRYFVAHPQHKQSIHTFILSLYEFAIHIFRFSAELLYISHFKVTPAEARLKVVDSGLWVPSLFDTRSPDCNGLTWIHYAPIVSTLITAGLGSKSYLDAYESLQNIQDITKRGHARHSLRCSSLRISWFSDIRKKMDLFKGVWPPTYFYLDSNQQQSTIQRGSQILLSAYPCASIKDLTMTDPIDHIRILSRPQKESWELAVALMGKPATEASMSKILLVESKNKSYLAEEDRLKKDLAAKQQRSMDTSLVEDQLQRTQNLKAMSVESIQKIHANLKLFTESARDPNLTFDAYRPCTTSLMHNYKLMLDIANLTAHPKPNVSKLTDDPPTPSLYSDMDMVVDDNDTGYDTLETNTNPMTTDTNGSLKITSVANTNKDAVTITSDLEEKSNKMIEDMGTEKQEHEEDKSEKQTDESEKQTDESEKQTDESEKQTDESEPQPNQKQKKIKKSSKKKTTNKVPEADVMEEDGEQDQPHTKLKVIKDSRKKTGSKKRVRFEENDDEEEGEDENDEDYTEVQKKASKPSSSKKRKTSKKQSVDVQDKDTQEKKVVEKEQAASSSNRASRKVKAAKKSSSKSKSTRVTETPLAAAEKKQSQNEEEGEDEEDNEIEILPGTPTQTEDVILTEEYYTDPSNMMNLIMKNLPSFSKVKIIHFLATLNELVSKQTRESLHQKK